MNTSETLEEVINELNQNFDNLISNDHINIDEIEVLTLSSVEECKKIINNHIEELLKNKIDEKKLISKKNENGKKKGLN